MYALTNTVRDYEWGTTDAIPQLLGAEPTGDPQAELWIGAHPASPSTAQTPGGATPLDALIRADPDAALGSAVAARFGGRLPFLLKVLSAAKPLSLQAHPSREQAEAGYAAEDRSGVPLDSPTRNYKDGNHKPELLCALTPFDALAGFAPVARSRELLESIRAVSGPSDVLDALVADLDSSDEGTALRAATERLLTLDPAAARDLTEQVVDGCSKIGGQAAATAAELHAHYPGDAGVVLALLLNRIRLQPGEAIFLPAGNLHAYLAGTGIEIMATSDNVLRGGLTSKQVDVPELLRVLDFTAAAPPLFQPPTVEAGVVVLEYRPAVEDFSLCMIELTAGGELRWDDELPRTAIVLDGALTLSSNAGQLGVGKGDSVFVAAADGPVTLRGSGRLAVAAPGA